MTRHRHFDPNSNGFMEHDHIHSGPHIHAYDRALGRIVSVLRPGNYAPVPDKDDES